MDLPELLGNSEEEQEFKFSFEVSEFIAVLRSTRKGETLELNRVSYNGRPAKLDLRKWKDAQPRKGFTLTDREARLLLDALQRLNLPEIEEESPLE